MLSRFVQKTVLNLSFVLGVAIRKSISVRRQKHSFRRWPAWYISQMRRPQTIPPRSALLHPAVVAQHFLIFEKMGERDVRLALAHGTFNSKQEKFARVWLQEHAKKTINQRSESSKRQQRITWLIAIVAVLITAAGAAVNYFK